MTDELDDARALVPSMRLDAAEQLDSGDRAAVHRVQARATDGREGSLIVKRYLAEREEWVREAAALATLPPELGAPAIVAIGAEPPIVIMTDVGKGTNLAEQLLADEPGRAARALTRWAEAMADVHVATAGLRAQFRAALDEHAGELPVHEARIGNDIDDAMRVLDRACGSLGVVVPPGALDEVRDLYHRLGGDGAAALTPADACPDNNMAVGDRLVLIDFENAQWRHIAWDVAYLRVPWPTCWCSWRLPAGVVDDAVAAYRHRAAPAFPQVSDDEFEREVEAATIGWSLMSAVYLDNALGQEAALSGRYRRAPSRRAVLVNRLEQAACSSELPAASELAARLAAELRTRWGDVRLDLAPAFR